jgi:hypothetical protein
MPRCCQLFFASCFLLLFLINNSLLLFGIITKNLEELIGGEKLQSTVLHYTLQNTLPTHTLTTTDNFPC